MPKNRYSSSGGRRSALAGMLLSLGLLSACGDDDAPERVATEEPAPSPGEGSGDGSATAPQLLAQDDFTHGLDNWKVEQEDTTGSVTAKDGVLDIIQPAGATIWFRQKLTGDYEISFSATPIPITIPNTRFIDRISDLNMFWNANDPRVQSGDPTHSTFDGALNSYNPVKLYYVGYGANSNRTTRLRRNDGSDSRPQIAGYATADVATAEDSSGDMTPATTLTANRPTQVRIVSRRATLDDTVTLKWYANDIEVFSYADPAPYLDGWFALRTTTSHLQIRDFKVRSLEPGQ